MRNHKETIALGLLLLTWLVYLPARNHEFITYDDPDYVTRNSHVQQGLTLEGVKWAFGELHGNGTYWHPLTWVSHMIDFQLFGLNPAGHHLMNVLFHSINVVLLFLLLFQFSAALWRSALAAALFALHPLQVDTVAWVAERKNVLSSMFWLLAMLAYGAYVQKKERRLGSYLLALVLFTLGLMCKPILVTWPCAMLLMDFWPLKRFGWRDGQPVSYKEWRAALSAFLRLVPEKMPFLTLAIVSSLITFQSHKEMGMTEIHGLPLWFRVENAFVSYARYLKKVVWPNDLAILYPHPGEWPESTVLISAVVVALITSWVVYSLRRRPFLAVGWFWFLGVLLPAIGIVQVGIQAMADRFAYLPLIGLITMLVWGAHAWGEKSGAKGLWLIGAAVVGLLTCLGLTNRQLGYWRNSESLYEHTLKVTEGNYLILNNLAHHLATSNRFDEAETHLRKAIAIRSNFAEPHYQLGAVLEKKAQYDQAMLEYEKAAQLKQDWALPWISIGNLTLLQRNTNEAIAAFQKGMQITPDAAIFPFQLAAIYTRQGKLAEAIEQYRKALRLSPDWQELLNNLAWLYATCPDEQCRDGAEAVRLASRACELTQRRVPVFIGTLAAAYAEAGQFEAAEKAAVEAIQLASSQGRHDLAEANKRLLASYQKRIPYREVQ